MSSFSLRNVLCGIALIVSLSYVNAYKFLGVLHTTARSHHIVGSALMKGLAAKGHEVTVISPYPLKKPIKNYHDIPMSKLMEIMNVDKMNLLTMIENSVVENMRFIHEMGIQMSRALLEEPEVHKLLQSNQTFDAVICEVFLSESLFGFAEHFKAPLIGLGTFGAHPWNTDMIGSPTPPSYVPNPMLHFTDRMSLMQRIGNLAYITFERIHMDYFYLPYQEQLYKEFFPHNKRNMYEVRKNAALVLLNQHVSLSSPRPYMPNQIEVGGMHINRKRTPLPSDIQKFIDEAKHGVIYFSMGSNLKSKLLPIEKRKEILDTFRGLPQRVLWKFEETNLEGKPDNVFISDWFPQDDILAHPNVRAFVTHGGLLSTTESIYHGKPIIGIPIFGDQFLNMARAEANGYGIQMDYQTLSASTFKAAIKRILDPRYTQLVKAMSQRYKDQPMEPLDTAVYWVEHVVRHKGMQYMHCAGLDLSFIQYHNIDALIILYGSLLVIFALIICLLKFLLRKALLLFASKPQKKIKKH